MKSLNLIKPALFLFITLCMASPAIKAQEIKNVSISNFSEVTVSAGLELIITQGDLESAKIIATPKLIDEVVVEQNGNRVDVKWKNHLDSKKVWKNRTAKVYINYKHLNVIEASSGSSIRTDNDLKTDHLDASVSSGALIEGKITCEDLKLEASSGATALLNGTAKNMTVESSSGGTVNALDLITDYAKAKASSGANIKINVSKGLEVTYSSGGSIHYKGNAELQNHSTNNKSGGSVRRIN